METGPLKSYLHFLGLLLASCVCATFEQILFISIYHINDGSLPELCMVGFTNSCTFRIGKEWK